MRAFFIVITWVWLYHVNMKMLKQQNALLDQMVLSTHISLDMEQEPSCEQKAVILQCHRAMLLNGTPESLEALREVLSFGVSGKTCLNLALQLDAEKIIHYLFDKSLVSEEDIRQAVLETEISGKEVSKDMVKRLSKRGLPLSYDQCPEELTKILDRGMFRYAEKLASSWDLDFLSKDDKDIALLNLMKAVIETDSPSSNFFINKLDLPIICNMWSRLLKAGADPYRVWNLSKDWDDKLAPQKPTSWWPIDCFRSVIPPPTACPAHLLIIAYNVLEPQFIDERSGKDNGGEAWWAEISSGIDPKKIPNDYLDRGPWSLLLTSHEGGSGCFRVLDNVSPVFKWLENAGVNPKDDMWPIWEMALLLYQRGNVSLFHYLLENNSEALIPPDNESLKGISSRVAALFGPGPSTTGVEGINLSFWWLNDAEKWGEKCLSGTNLKAWNEQISRMTSAMEARKNDTREVFNALCEDASLNASVLWNTSNSVRQVIRL